MIKSALIKNCWNIKNSEIEFSPYVNIFSGESTQGKSRYLKSLILAIQNKPQGFPYQPWNSKRGEKSSSTIFFEDFSATRERSNSTNKYILHDDKEKVFEAMGNDVPSQISELINIPDYLIHTQHDGYFLIGNDQSPGKVAKEINKICNLEIIDTVTSNINIIVNEINSDIKYTKKDIKEKEDKIKNLGYVDDFYLLVNAVDELLKEKENFENDIEYLENVYNNLESKLSENGEINNLLNQAEKIKELVSLINEYEIISKDIQNISKSISVIGKLNKDIRNTKKLVAFEKEIRSTLNNVEEYKKIKNEIAELSHSFKKITKLLRNNSDISEKIVFEKEIKETLLNISEYSKISEDICFLKNKSNTISLKIDETNKTEKEIENLKKEYSEEFAKLEICPLCKQKVKQDL